MLIFIYLISLVNSEIYGTSCRINYCLRCNDQKTKCLECVEYYAVDAGTGKCMEKSSYNTSKYKVCPDGYNYNSVTKKCNTPENTCPEGCKTCAQGKCTSCKTGYYLENYKCVLDPYMNEYGFCMIGYRDVNDICVKGQDHCITHHNETNTCVKCAEGYYEAYDGSCQNITIANCLTTYDGTTCAQCKEGFGWDASGKKCATCTNTECELCWTTTTCSKCKDGKILTKYRFANEKDANGNWIWKDKTSCLTPIEHCGIYPDSMTTVISCEYCEMDYYLASDGTCKKCSESICTQITPTRGNFLTCPYHCRDGLTLDSAKRPNTNECFTTTLGGKKYCRMCQLGYFMNKNLQCEKCNEKCKGYCRGTKDTCFCVSFYSQGCELYSDDGCSCKKCGIDYKLVKGKCEPKTKGCHAYRGDGTCGECYQGNIIYLATGNECLEPPEFTDDENEDGGNGGVGKTIIKMVILIIVVFIF